MKLFLLIMIFMVTSCQTQESERYVPIEIIPVKHIFLTPPEIKAMFANHGQKAANKEMLTQQAKERELSTIPKNTFFTSRQLARRKAYKKINYQSKGHADLRASDSEVENQWNGTCTAHALRNVIDNAAHVTVSTRHIWDEYGIYSCESAINAWENKGCITYANTWSHDSKTPQSDYLSINNCTTYLKQSTYIEDDIDKMKESLDKGFPVYLGITVTASMMNCDSVLSPTSKASSGGHALAIVGYKDDEQIKGGGYFIIKNSWGRDCGDAGYQYLPYQYCKRKDMYCVAWSIDKVDTKIAPPEPIFPPKNKCSKWTRSWRTLWMKECIEWEQQINLLAID